MVRAGIVRLTVSDTIKFSSGRSISPFRGGVAIDTKGVAFEADTHGEIHVNLTQEDYDEENWDKDTRLLPSERRELAHMMVKRWKTYGGIP